MTEMAQQRWPVVGVSAAVFRGADVLIIKRGRQPFADHWSLPGGRVEAGETLEGAIHREIAEETGVTVDLIGLNDLIQPIARDKGGMLTSHYVIVSFTARYVSGDMRPGDDAADVAWVDPGMLSEFLTTPDLPRIVRQARRIAAANQIAN